MCSSYQEGHNEDLELVGFIFLPLAVSCVFTEFLSFCSMVSVCLQSGCLIIGFFIYFDHFFDALFASK